MCKCTRKPSLVPGTVHSSIVNIISNRPTHPNIIFISTKIDPQNSTERGGWEEASDGPWELGLGEAKGCVAYIPPSMGNHSLLCGEGNRQTEPSSRTPNSPRWGHNQELALHRDGAKARPTRSAPATAISWGYHHPREEKQSPHLECSVCSASSPVPGCLWVAELPQQGQDSKEIWQRGVPSFGTPSCTAAQGRVTGAPFGESPERWLFTVGFVVFVFF